MGGERSLRTENSNCFVQPVLRKIYLTQAEPFQKVNTPHIVMQRALNIALIFEEYMIQSHESAR